MTCHLLPVDALSEQSNNHIAFVTSSMSLLFLVIVATLPPVFIVVAGKARGAGPFAILVFLAGWMYLSLLRSINETLPFAGVGDDLDYFRASQVTFRGPSEWFDLSRFKWTHEQAGYPLLLAWIHQIAGGSLFHRKALNVLWHLLLADVWFVIGRIAGGNRLAFPFGVAILLGTPLWHYWMFLLKDMTITLLQSVFLLSLVMLVAQNRRLLGAGGVLMTTLLVIPFRSLLALLHIAIMSVAIWGRQRAAKGQRFSLIGRVLISAVIGSAILVVGRNPSVMGQLGVRTESRHLDASAVEQAVQFRAAAGQQSPGKFSLVFLVGEVNTFNPNSWAHPGPSDYRAMGMIPWIYLGLPMFIVGVYRTFRPPKALSDAGLTAKSAPIPLAAGATPSPTEPAWKPDRSVLLILLLFIVAYFAVAWLSHDTTRWRLPAMPPMLAIAAWGWVCLKTVSARIQILFAWGFGVSVFAVIYYTLFK